MSHRSSAMMLTDHIRERVLAATDYTSLPDRRIVNMPNFHRRHYVSYGVIAWCKSTNKWLLVRSKYSYAFMNYLNASYRKADVPVLIQSMTNEEISIIRQLYHNQVRWEDVYHGFHSDEVYRRYKQSRDWVRPYLNYEGTIATPWTYPKGRIEPDETPIECAIREFQEETGLNILGVCVEPYPITEKYISFNHVTYETKCWLHVFETEPDWRDIQPEIEDEIAERKWMSAEEAKNCLSTSKIGMLEKAIQVLKNKGYEEIS